MLDVSKVGGGQVRMIFAEPEQEGGFGSKLRPAVAGAVGGVQHLGC